MDVCFDLSFMAMVIPSLFYSCYVKWVASESDSLKNSILNLICILKSFGHEIEPIYASLIFFSFFSFINITNTLEFSAYYLVTMLRTAATFFNDKLTRYSFKEI